MRKRSTKLGSNLKRRATRSKHELAYMLMWGEEVPKGRKTLKRGYR